MASMPLAMFPCERVMTNVRAQSIRLKYSHGPSLTAHSEIQLAANRAISTEGAVPMKLAVVAAESARTASPFLVIS